MMSVRRCLSFLAALVVTLSPAAFAEPAALCDNSAPANASLSQEQDAQGFICLARLCETDEECAFSCSSARTAACIDNTCHYPYGTGGGGGGGFGCAHDRGIVAHGWFGRDTGQERRDSRRR